MTTATTSTNATATTDASTTATPDRPAYKVTARRVLRAEWAKLWSLHSSWITLGVALLLLIALGAIASAVYSPDAPTNAAPGPPQASDAVGLALTGATFASLAIGVLGVLITAGEYSTGMIRSTMAAVPRRLPVLWSKAAVFGVIAAIVTGLGALGAFLLGSVGLHGDKIALSLGDPGVVRSLLGAGLYLGLVGVFGVALGALVRSAAGGIGILVALLLIVPGLTSLLPDSWSDTLSPYLPSNAGGAVMSLHQSAGSLAPWAGLAVFAAWVAVLLAGAAYRLVRSDV